MTKTIKLGKCKECRTILSKTKGVMFNLWMKQPYVFYFNREQINPLHMMFVFFPIDVVFLNSDKEVVEIKENLRPFALYTPKERSKYVIEMKKGKIKEKNIKLKDKIYLKF